MRSWPARARSHAWLVDRLRDFGADALYERIALHSAAGSTAARALGIPHIVELNAPLPEEAARYRRLERPEDADRLERATLSHADLVLAGVQPARRLRARRGAQRVEVTPNAVAPERFADLPPRDPSAPPVAVFSGALRPWHGIETIAEAWALLDGDAPRLRVIGDGPARDVVAAAGAEMLGAVPHEHVPRLLGEADIGLAPYSPDAPAYFSPLKLFEYLAAGLAIVAADIPGVRDVTGSEAAVLIPPGDAPALARGGRRAGGRSRRARAPRLRSSGAGRGAHLAAARAAHRRSRQGALAKNRRRRDRRRRKRRGRLPDDAPVLRPYVRQQWPPLARSRRSRRS